MKHSEIEKDIRRKNSERFSRHEPMTLSEVFHKTAGIAFTFGSAAVTFYTMAQDFPVINIAGFDLSTQIPAIAVTFTGVGLGMAYGAIDGRKTIKERLLELNHAGLKRSFCAIAAACGIFLGVHRYEQDQCPDPAMCEGITISPKQIPLTDCPKLK